MRRAVILLAAVALAACGEKSVPSRATATPTPTPTEVAAAPAPESGPWTLRDRDSRTPLRCPASSARAGWPSRVLALGDGTYVKLWGRRPRLATVDARGHLLSQKELGAKEPADERVLACGRGGRTAAAWTAYRSEGLESVTGTYRVLVDGQTVDTVHVAYNPPDLAVAFAPDGSVLVAYSVDKAVRAVVITDGRPSLPITLGPASNVSTVAAEIGSGGRAVVAWTTIDAGEERNERRRVYAVTGRDGRFGRAQRVDRAKHLNIAEFSSSEIRLAVAPNGRALLMWSTAATGDEDDRYTVRTAGASRSGHFGKPRQLSSNGDVGDVAIRSDGSKIVAWTDDEGLHAGDELVADGPIKEPRASFRDGKPHLEWHGGEATRG
jgi:hypothetical protein